MLRRVRNVVSALAAIAPLVLVPMWVRSYYHADEFCAGLFGDRTIIVSSKLGRVTAVFLGPAPVMAPKRWSVTVRTLSEGASFPVGQIRDYESVLGFGWVQDPDYVLSVENSSGSVLKWASSSSGRGSTTLTLTDPSGRAGRATSTWTRPSLPGPPGQAVANFGVSGTDFTMRVSVVHGLHGCGPIVPYWFLLLFAGVVFVLTQLHRPRQFSLRTLLAATTYTAVILALTIVLCR